MSLKFDPRCKTCQAVQADQALFRRILNSRAYVTGGESLSKICETTGLPYRSMTVHTKKHQGISPGDLKRKQLAAIQKKAAQGQVDQVLSTQGTRDKVLDQLSTMLSEKEEVVIGQDIKLKDVLALLLRAAKDTDDVTAKQKDQQIDIVKMMRGARSGEVAEGTVVEGDIQVDDDGYDYS